MSLKLDHQSQANETGKLDHQSQAIETGELDDQCQAISTGSYIINVWLLKQGS